MTTTKQRNNDIEQSKRHRRRRSSPSSITSTCRSAGIYVMRVLILPIGALYVMYHILPSIVWIQCITLSPVWLCLYTVIAKVVQRHQTLQQQQQSLLLLLQQCCIPIILVITVVAAQLPLSIATGMAVSMIVLFSLFTIPQSSNNNSSTNNDTHRCNGNKDHHTNTTTLNDTSSSTSTKTPPQKQVSFVTVVVAVMIVIIVLLCENFLIWVVSATFVPGQSITTAPPPLQDNGQRIITYIFDQLLHLSKYQVVSLRRLWNTQWALVSCLGASLGIIEMVHPNRRTLYGIATRMAYTVAMARCIRTISFLFTVIPSQVPNCYAQRFPVPPPTHWIDWIWVGLIPRSHGGCNDLIVSGHATVTSSMACVATSVAKDRLFSIALWTMVVLDYAVEIYEGFHYSVDMWLGLVLVSLLWRVLEPLEKGIIVDDDATTTTTMSLLSVQSTQQEGSASGVVDAAVHNQITTTTTPNPPRQSTQQRQRVMMLYYCIPAIVAYLQLNVLPQWTANFVIVLYAVVSIGIYLVFVATATASSSNNNYKSKLCMHYIQHILLCLLFLALAIYL